MALTSAEGINQWIFSGLSYKAMVFWIGGFNSEVQSYLSCALHKNLALGAYDELTGQDKC
jgi:hypothetical protein